MPLMFCLACYYCDLAKRWWEVGYCMKKQFSIHDPFKMCAVGKESTHTLNRKGQNLLHFYREREAIQAKRRKYLEEWIEAMGWNDP